MSFTLRLPQSTKFISQGKYTFVVGYKDFNIEDGTLKPLICAKSPYLVSKYRSFWVIEGEFNDPQTMIITHHGDQLLASQLNTKLRLGMHAYYKYFYGRDSVLILSKVENITATGDMTFTSSQFLIPSYEYAYRLLYTYDLTSHPHKVAEASLNFWLKIGGE